MRLTFTVKHHLKLVSAIIFICLASALMIARFTPASSAPRLAPVPATDITDPSHLQTAIFAGGCFWGMQGVFQHVNGVISSVAGYAGGSAETATYIQTETGTTGHAEAVRITFDPRVVSYGTLLRIFFSVAHDPTQLDRQGPDTGTQYPSAIFPLNREQADVAQKYITQINRSGIFKTRIATNIELGKTFYPAESYHQNYLYEHPTQLYITVYELPKIKDLKDIFPAQFRTDPVLVAK